ncbi:MULTISPECIES: OsmC family protein [Vibrio]|nr:MULTISPECIES: OsmC family protein [Vibrio]MBF9002564.1 OsmC family protein [Vibrio nitrifigilis]
MSVSVEWQKDYQFDVVTDQNFTFTIDANSEKAPSPTDVLLSSLGSCCASDVVAELRARGAELFGLKTTMSYKLTDTEPRVYDSVNLHFVIKGTGVNETMVTEVIENSIEHQCHVCRMLKSSMSITYTYHYVKLAA